MTEREQLEAAIAGLEAQRALLGDDLVNTALASLRTQLQALPATLPAEQQRKQVTILFADISGFTAMSERMDAEEVGEIMNTLWARLDRVIVRHGGVVDKHIGDGLMAIFGIPQAREDDPEQAIHAALALQQELTCFQGDPHLQMRIGLNTGPVFLGQVGTTGEYTALGDTVNVASRLEHSAPIGGILISDETYRPVRGIFEVQTLAPLAVKGKRDRVQAYIVERAKPWALRTQRRGVEGIETQTIGREHEQSVLQQAWATTLQTQQLQALTISAQAGVGKSRLLDEFTHWLDLAPAAHRRLYGRANLNTAGHPYALLRDLFSVLFQIQESDSAVTARQKLVDGVLESIPADLGALEKAHFLGQLIGFDFSASPYLQGILSDAKQIQSRAFHYAGQFFSQVAAGTPLVFCLDDIHWADEGSLDFFTHLTQACRPRPILIVYLTRPDLFEHRPAWATGAGHIRLNLHPLSADYTRELIREILRKLPDLPLAISDLIATRSEGNPFYIEELIKMLIDQAVIVPGPEHWAARVDRLDTVQVPSTLAGVIQARLDGLPALDREILQRAAIIGRVFWEEWVAQLTGKPRKISAADVGQCLETLQAKEIVFQREPSTLSGTDEYSFKHALLHEVTYESVLKRQRRIYHEQAARWLIGRNGERADENAGMIAEHFERAANPAAAARWYARAGKQAQLTWAPNLAIHYYDKALTLLPDTGDPTVQAGRLPWQEGMGDVLALQARYTEAIAIYQELEKIAGELGDPHTQARCWEKVTEAQVWLGMLPVALESADRAIHFAQAPGSESVRIAALAHKCIIFSLLGDHTASLPFGEEALRRSRVQGGPRETAVSLRALGVAHRVLGHYKEAIAFFEEGLVFYRQLGDRRGVGDLRANAGVGFLVQGAYQTAIAYFQEALVNAREIRHVQIEMIALNYLGGAHLRLGEYAAAEQYLLQVIETIGSTTNFTLAGTCIFLAETYLGQGKWGEARKTAVQALELARASKQVRLISSAWRVLGMVAAQDRATSGERRAELVDDLQSPAACFAESERLGVEADLPGEQAQTLRAWARYEFSTGNAATAWARWQQARDLFTRAGADYEVLEMDTERRGVQL
ncbi:MAG TPA: adenylate/guanylate cyclase domain-containing protein [Chloroflexia bacterium]|nr:adenylate/guanylate cyclase domain-containing protein [Chloroflexia bacterium]